MNRDREMLLELYDATTHLLQRLDPKECFLTFNAMQSEKKLKEKRKQVAHYLRQEANERDYGSGYRPIEREDSDSSNSLSG